MKKGEMKIDGTYILCPDKACKLFCVENESLPCEDKCPKQDELKKIIICQLCKEIIELDGNHSMLRRVDHKCGASNFQRASGKHYLIYKRPE